MVPQRRHNLSHNDLIGIFAYQSEHKHTVLSQIVLTERSEKFLVELFPAQPVHEFQVLLKEADSVPWKWVPHPKEETVDGGERHIDQPKPDENEYLLVEEVYGQSALHHVVVYIVA